MALSTTSKLLLRPTVLALFALLTMPVHALQVRISGEALSIHATNAPLQDILKAVGAYGVKVRIDPRINPILSVDFDNKDVDKALGRLLRPFEYVFLWDVVKAPIGTIARLAEVQVFMNGEKQNMKPLPADAGTAALTQPGSIRIVFVKGEILLRLVRGTDIQAFKRLLAQIGGTVVDCLPELGIYRVKLPPETDVFALSRQLASNPIISRAEPNFAYRAPTPSLISANAGVRFPSPPSVRESGKPAAVAVLDTGLLPQPALQELLSATLDAVDPGRAITDPDGHGTQMAFIASGAISPDGITQTDDSTGVPLVAIRAFDGNGYGTDYAIMESIVFAASKGARVISMSWSSEVRSEFLAQAMDYANSLGMIPVAAAGNEPTGKPEYPTAYAGVVAVSALAPDGTPWDRSNHGDFVDLSAPGFATLPVGHRGSPGAYAGTSIATAFVANTLARYCAEHPDAQPQQVLSALAGSLTPMGEKERKAGYGLGALDSEAIAEFLK